MHTYYIVFADDCHNIQCVEVQAEGQEEARELVKKAWGDDWIATMVFRHPPNGVVLSLEDIEQNDA